MTEQDYERLNSQDTFRIAAVYKKMQGNNIICAQDSNFALNPTVLYKKLVYCLAKQSMLIKKTLLNQIISMCTERWVSGEYSQNAFGR